MREMKDSNIVWLGTIPSDWNILRVKNTSWLKGRIGWDGLKSEEFTDEGPYLITGTDFSGGKVNWDTCAHITEDRFSEDELLHVKEGDLLITKDGTIGKLAIVEECPEKVSLNSGVMIIRNNSSWRYDQKFMYYILGSEVFTQWFESEQKPGSTIRHLYQHQFGEFRFPFPSLSEQRSIVSYLDKKCAAIDEAIARRQQIIERLENYRKAVILKAVTKGLNQDVEMKESGIPWIGSIPKSWKVTRVKYGISVSGSGTTPKSDNPKYYNGTIPWIQSGDLYFRKEVDETSKHVTELALNTCPALKLYKPPFIVMAMYGASVGNVAISNIEACVNQACCVLKPTQNVKMEFLSYWLNVCKEDLVSQAIGGGQPNISQRTIKEEALLIPPLSEQSEIVAFLDDTCERIDDIYARNIELILRLEEYRKSIIYNAITGKIDCREVV